MENLTVISGSGEQFDLMLPAPEKLRQTVAVIRYLLKNDPSAGAPGIAPLLRCFFPPRCRKSLEKISLEDTLKLIHAFSFILKEHEKHNALSDSARDWGGEGERIPGGLAEEAAGTEKKSSDRTFPGYKEFSEGHICSGSEKKTLPVFSGMQSSANENEMIFPEREEMEFLLTSQVSSVGNPFPCQPPPADEQGTPAGNAFPQQPPPAEEQETPEGKPCPHQPPPAEEQGTPVGNPFPHQPPPAEEQETPVGKPFPHQPLPAEEQETPGEKAQSSFHFPRWAEKLLECLYRFRGGERLPPAPGRTPEEGEEGNSLSAEKRTGTPERYSKTFFAEEPPSALSGTFTFADEAQGFSDEVIILCFCYKWTLEYGASLAPEIRKRCLEAAGIRRKEDDHHRTSAENLSADEILRAVRRGREALRRFREE